MRLTDKHSLSEWTGSQIKPTDLREWWNKVRIGKSLLGSNWCLIVNESQGMPKPVIEIFLDILENLPDWVTVIFTTTKKGADLFEDKQLDALPFASRCICIKLAERDLAKPFAVRLQEIAALENLDGQPLAKYEQLVNKCRADFREALNRIEQGEMLK